MPLTKRRSGLSSSALTGLDTVIPEAAAEDTAQPSKPAGTDTTTGGKKMLAVYVPKKLLESVKDAVSALGSRQDDPHGFPEFPEIAVRAELARLQQDRNDGWPFPRRARRQLVCGRRAD